MTRWYKKEDIAAPSDKAHMAGVTITVWKERMVSDEGSKNIPHQIVQAVTTAVEWLDHAINQLTVPNYLDAKSSLAKIYLHVYRDVIKAPPVNPQLSEKARADQQKELEFSVRMRMNDLRMILTNIKIGLSKDQIIKVNDAHTIKDGEKKHYLGLVKAAPGGKEYGKITIGFRAFREGHNLPRIVIHEAAHKFTLATDGKNTGGYWKQDFSDYLDPEAMNHVACLNNADSHALFVWAMNIGQGGAPEISSQFAEGMENRWRKHLGGA